MTKKESIKPEKYRYGRQGGWLFIPTVAIILFNPQAGADYAEGPRVLEEVLVTAQRRSERSTDVPISITAIDSELLRQADVQQLSDIMQLTPGLRFDKVAGFYQPTIRGIGTAVAVAGGSSNVGVYTDGFYSPNPLAANFDLLNVESVQVLKGPQGTLFGRNSTGGAILVTTSRPSTEESAELELSYGNYDTRRYNLYATGGSGKYAFDVAGSLRTGDGHVENIVTGSSTDGEYDNSVGRLGISFDLTDRVSMLLRYSYADTEDNSAVAANAFVDDGVVHATAAHPAYGFRVATEPDEVSNGFLPIYQSELEVTQLTVTAEMDFATLTSHTQYREETATHHQDYDLSETVFFHLIFDNNDKVFTQEFLLSSVDESPLQWTAGLFYFSNHSVFENNRGQTPLTGGAFVPNGGSGVKYTSLAAFGDLTYAWGEDLFITAGLRYSDDEGEDGYLIGTTLMRREAPDLNDSQLSPRLAVRYVTSENSSIYASYTEGYKSAILNVGGASLDGIEVAPEEVAAYELGYKYWSGDIAVDLAAYYYDYKDLQVASYVGAMSVIKNAADSSIYGVEGQFHYAVSEQLRLSVGANYLHAEYDTFEESQVWNQCVDPACGNSLGIFLSSFTDASGYEMQRSPELTANLAASYTTEVGGGELALSGTLYYTSDFFFDSSEVYRQEAYELFNARAEWTDHSDRYSIAVFGNNLTDAEYLNQVVPQFYGAYTTWGAPRTYGISLGLRYH